MRIARTDVHIDTMLPALSAHAVPAPGASSALASISAPELPTRAPDLVGSGWLGQALRGFRSWRDDHGQTVCFDDGAGFHVARAGHVIEGLALPVDDALCEELLLGPALLLALAERGLFALHASAVLGSAGAVLLLGPSGSGKSSLARHARAEGGLRLADDVAPVFCAEQGPRLLPRFPQLKLSPCLSVDDLDVPIAALVWVEIGDALATTALGEGDAVRRLLRDSVAARLFTPDILARHLDVCAALAQRLPVWRLTMPRVQPAQVPAAIASAHALLRMHGLP